MTDESETLKGFHREADQIREVVDAKIGTVWTAIDGIRAVLERITASVEKQAEQNVQLAVIANTVSHFQQSFVEHRAHTEDALDDHGNRIRSLEERAKLNEWGRKGLWTAVGVAITATGAFLTTNFSAILSALGMG
jgi:hypothetical protein